MAPDANAPGVLVTRPRGPASDGLCDRLRAHGYRPCAQPLLEILPLDELPPRQRQYAQDLDRYQHVIFISTNAVRFGLDVLAQFWPQWPVGLCWYAIGEATAALLDTHGIGASTPGATMTSEGLLSLDSLQAMDGDRVLIVKGEGGRETLASVLRERGARVDELQCYRRHCPQLAEGELAATLESRKIDVVLISSGEGLANFRRLLSPSESTNLGALRLIVPSERVAALAREMGFRHVDVAANASDASMLGTLEETVPAAGSGQ